MRKKPLSTFEREMKNPKFKKAFEKSYKEFLLSELLIAIMEEDGRSVRKLAREVGLSPTIIQKLRTAKQPDIKMKNFIRLSHACGYEVILHKGKNQIRLKENKVS